MSRQSPRGGAPVMSARTQTYPAIEGERDLASRVAQPTDANHAAIPEGSAPNVSPESVTFDVESAARKPRQGHMGGTPAAHRRHASSAPTAGTTRSTTPPTVEGGPGRASEPARTAARESKVIVAFGMTITPRKDDTTTPHEPLCDPRRGDTQGTPRRQNDPHDSASVCGSHVALTPTSRAEPARRGARHAVSASTLDDDASGTRSLAEEHALSSSSDRSSPSPLARRATDYRHFATRARSGTRTPRSTR